MARDSGKVEKATKETSEAHGAGGAAGRGSPIKREVGGILLLALAIFLGLSLLSLELGAGTLMGPGGAFVAVCCYGLFGVAAQLGALLLGVAAVRLLRGQTNHVRGLLAGAFTAGVFFTSVLLHLSTGHYRLRGYSTGGLVGEYGAEVMAAFLGTAGTVLFGLTGLLLSAVLTTSLTTSGLGRALTRTGLLLWRGLRRAWLAVLPTRTAARALEEPIFGAHAVSPLSSLADTRKMLPSRAADLTQQVGENAIVGEQPIISVLGDEKQRKRRGRADMPVVAAVATESAALQQSIDPAAPVGPVGPLEVCPVKASPTDATTKAAAPIGPLESDPTEATITEAPETTFPLAAEAAALPGLPAMPAIIAPVRAKPAPIALIPRPPMVAEAPAKSPLDYIRLGSGEYRLPDLSLLDFDDPGHGDLDRQAMLELASRLEKTLADYGVKGRVSEIHPGPVVTMYEFVPQAGTKLSKITALSNDLAMALEALKVRIVAPIPGKAAVGIEVPNRVRETVFLKEIIGSDVFARSKSKLTMALGKDIAGAPTCVDLAKMPHLLVAGTTGSGKSVSVNAMICSLLFNASPEEVKLIMIDPKMLELSIYEGIPHLLLPVVTDPKKANLALRWAVEEMERRYDLISKSGVRDIASYNKKLEKHLADDAAREAEEKSAVAGVSRGRAESQGMLVEPKRIRVWVKDEAGEREVEVEATADAVEAAGGVVSEDVLDDISAAVAAAHKESMEQLELEGKRSEPLRKLPYIVIIIDEFADLMMVASKEVEMSVARIAQKARAAGIHLLLATQRPSVDVITGLIKANFPSRIAFQVVSKIDARTILDQQGAESLLGMGDMLFTDRGLALKRVHGPLVTDVEIHRIVEFLKAQGKPVYDLDILKPRAEDDGGEAEVEDLSDEMYDQAVAVISEMRQASTSMLQRRLRLGYNRAARIIERMEREGIVGPADGARPRDVLIHSHAA